MADDAQDRTLAPTPQRRHHAREQGHVAKSGDLAGVIVVLGSLGLLMFLGAGVVDLLGRLSVSHWSGEAWRSLDAESVVGWWNEIIAGLAGVLLPILVSMFLLAVAAHLVQTGFLFAPQRVSPDWQRINLLSGLGRVLSFHSGGRLGMAVIKITMVTAVAGWCLYSELDRLLATPGMELPQLGRYLLTTMLTASLKVAGALAGVALLDYGYQRWKHERDLRMTPEEMREELRSSEGDPAVGSRRQALERQMLHSREKV